MSIPNDARMVYRINALAMFRGAFPPADLATIAKALNDDPSGQFQTVHAIGNAIIYDWAPRFDINPNATLELHKLITTPKGVQFSAMNVTRIRSL